MNVHPARGLATDMNVHPTLALATDKNVHPTSESGLDESFDSNSLQFDTFPPHCFDARCRASREIEDSRQAVSLHQTRTGLMKLSLLLVFFGALLFTFKAAADDRIHYGRDVRPVLSRYCLACHEADAFADDSSPDAVGMAVDRILAKPSYGERRSAMWLDLARYGDSQRLGYEAHAEADRELFNVSPVVSRLTGTVSA